MVALTQFGAPALVLLVVLQWWVKKDRLHDRHAVLAAGLSCLLGLFLNQIILLFVHRVRPYDAGVTHLLIPPSTDWSFPSDHATASMAIAAAFALQRLPRRALVLFVLALAICWSRVFVGTHYLTDVIGGALTGVPAALIVRLAYREDAEPRGVDLHTASTIGKNRYCGYWGLCARFRALSGGVLDDAHRGEPG